MQPEQSERKSLHFIVKMAAIHFFFFSFKAGIRGEKNELEDEQRPAFVFEAG